MASNRLIPTYVNAKEFASWIMDKRDAVRAVYSTLTEPTLSEINDRLIKAEAAVNQETRCAWKAHTVLNETVWQAYQGTFTQFAYRTNMLNRKTMPQVTALVHNPIISVTSIKPIIDGIETEIIGNSAYTEGWENDYWIDYQNGAIFWKSLVPRYRTPVKVSYTYGNIETQEGNVIMDGALLTSTTVSNTVLSVDIVSEDHQYAGKLMEMTSGTADGKTYRVIDSSYNTTSTFTNLTLMTGSAASTDLVGCGDTFAIYAVPEDVKEMTLLHAYLGILNVDPTYQFNYSNPYDDPMPQYQQIEMLYNRFRDLVAKRTVNINLVN